MTIHIERATTASISPAQFQQLVLLFQQLSQSANENLVRDAIQSEQNRVLVALNGQQVVVGALIVAMTPCASGSRVHIEDVVVDTNCRRQGIATHLFNEAFKRATADFKPKSIDLTSRPDRAEANRLYQKLGFIQRDTNVYRYTPTYD
ncbi:acyl-CoA N-acyltransferase [Fennellomyces sp. T-0311]|nr:acyl-CoA N-acyltransferase [Fennellomyces sp. T-0311]